MRKYICSVFICIMLWVSAISVNAESYPEFYITDAKGEQGDEVIVQVGIKNNPGIVSYRVLVDYDQEAMTITDVKSIDYVDISFGPKENAPLSMLWCDAIHGNNYNDGVIAEISFKIKESVPDSEYALMVTYDKEDVFNSNFENVYFDVNNGKLSVKTNSNRNTDKFQNDDNSKAGDKKSGEALSEKDGSIKTKTDIGTTNSKTESKSNDNSVSEKIISEKDTHNNLDLNSDSEREIVSEDRNGIEKSKRNNSDSATDESLNNGSVSEGETSTLSDFEINERRNDYHSSDSGDKSSDNTSTKNEVNTIFLVGSIILLIVVIIIVIIQRKHNK